jgi:hypothetical protein
MAMRSTTTGKIAMGQFGLNFVTIADVNTIYVDIEYLNPCQAP